MVDPRTARRWGYRALYLAICAGLIFLHLLPVDLQAGRYPGPDIMLCLTVAWVLRRPRFVPIWLIAFVFLVADMLFMRPPGLWTALVVIGVEFLRAREAQSRETSFSAEWAMVAAVLAVMTLANRAILGLTMVEQVSLGLTLLQLVFTVLAYPVVVLVSRVLFGVRKIAPGELEALGRPV